MTSPINFQHRWCNLVGHRYANNDDTEFDCNTLSGTVTVVVVVVVVVGARRSRKKKICLFQHSYAVVRSAAPNKISDTSPSNTRQDERK